MSSDHFEIPITWKDTEISFPARFISAGYVTKIAVDMHGQDLLLEPDEEGLYRLVLEADAFGNYPEVNLTLVKEITGVLNEVSGRS